MPMTHPVRFEETTSIRTTGAFHIIIYKFKINIFHSYCHQDEFNGIVFRFILQF